MLVFVYLSGRRVIFENNENIHQKYFSYHSDVLNNIFMSMELSKFQENNFVKDKVF